MIDLILTPPIDTADLILSPRIVLMRKVRDKIITRVPESEEFKKAKKKINQDIPIVLIDKPNPMRHSLYMKPRELSKMIERYEKNPKGIRSRIFKAIYGIDQAKLTPSQLRREKEKGSILLDKNIKSLYPLAKAYEQGKLHQKIGFLSELPNWGLGVGPLVSALPSFSPTRKIIEKQHWVTPEKIGKIGNYLTMLSIATYLAKNIFLAHKAHETVKQFAPKQAQDRKEKLMRILDITTLIPATT